MSIMCKHKWTMLSETKTESQIEQIKAMGFSSMPAPANDVHLDKMTKRKLIQILACEKCGKLKRFITDI